MTVQALQETSLKIFHDCCLMRGLTLSAPHGMATNPGGSACGVACGVGRLGNGPRTSSRVGPLEPLEDTPSPASLRSRSSQLLESTAFSSASCAFTACSVATSSEPAPEPFCARSCRTSSCSAAFCSASRDTYMHAHVFDTDDDSPKAPQAFLGMGTPGWKQLPWRRLCHMLLHKVWQLPGVRQDVCEKVCCRHGQPESSAPQTRLVEHDASGWTRTAAGGLAAVQAITAMG